MELSIEKMKKSQKDKVISQKRRKFLSNYFTGSRKMTNKENDIKIILKENIQFCLETGWKFCSIRNGILKILDN